MSQDGFRKIAYWDSTDGVILTRDLSEVYSQISQSLHNKTVSRSSTGAFLFLNK